LNLRRLLPSSEPSPAAPPAPQPSGRAWKTGIDRFVLRGGGVRFRDLTLGEGAPLDVALPDVTVRDVALQPGLYGDPGVARVYVKSEGGVLRIECRLWVLDQGFAVATRLKAFRIPLHRARLYIPGIGWSELAGERGSALALDGGRPRPRRLEGLPAAGRLAARRGDHGVGATARQPRRPRPGRPEAVRPTGLGRRGRCRPRDTAGVRRHRPDRAAAGPGSRPRGARGRRRVAGASPGRGARCGPGRRGRPLSRRRRFGP